MNDNELIKALRLDRTVEILARRAAAIIENDYKEPVYGSSTYLLVMEDIPYLIDQLAERDKEQESQSKRKRSKTCWSCGAVCDDAGKDDGGFCPAWQPKKEAQHE